MRIKRIAALTALFMLMAVFTFSLTVFAEPVDATTAPAAPAAPVTETTTPAPAPTAAPTVPAPTLSPNALTPNGQASVLNYYQSDSDDKEFTRLLHRRVTSFIWSWTERVALKTSTFSMP